MSTEASLYLCISGRDIVQKLWTHKRGQVIAAIKFATVILLEMALKDIQ